MDELSGDLDDGTAERERHSRALFVVASVCLISAAAAWILASRYEAAGSDSIPTQIHSEHQVSEDDDAPLDRTSHLPPVRQSGIGTNAG